MNVRKFGRAIREAEKYVHSGEYEMNRIYLRDETLNWLQIVADESDITMPRLLNSSVAFGALRALATKCGMDSFIVDEKAKRLYDPPSLSSIYTPDPSMDSLAVFGLHARNIVLARIAQKECQLSLDALADDGLRITNVFAGKNPDTYYSYRGFKESRAGEVITVANFILRPEYDLSSIEPSPDL